LYQADNAYVLRAFDVYSDKSQSFAFGLKFDSNVLSWTIDFGQGKKTANP
jgi:hypothetical protein